MPRLRFAPWKAAAGAAVFSVALTLLVLRIQPALAQLVGSPPKVDFPVLPDGQVTATPQPIQVQALDATHFVVVTREVRLASPTNGDGRWHQMLVTVVTHYTVQGNKLVPLEHVRVPHGYRAYGQ